MNGMEWNDATDLFLTFLKFHGYGRYMRNGLPWRRTSYFFFNVMHLLAGRKVGG